MIPRGNGNEPAEINNIPGPLDGVDFNIQYPIFNLQQIKFEEQEGKFQIPLGVGFAIGFGTDDFDPDADFR